MPEEDELEFIKEFVIHSNEGSHHGVVFDLTGKEEVTDLTALPSSEDLGSGNDEDDSSMDE